MAVLMWGWGGPWMGFGRIVPLIALLFMVVTVFACVRMMGGGTGGNAGPRSGEIEELRYEVGELQEEVRWLRDRT